MIGDVPSATAILDRLLHHAEVLSFNGKSYRLRKQLPSAAAEVATDSNDDPLVTSDAAAPKPANAPTGSVAATDPKPNRSTRKNPPATIAAT